MTRRDAYGIQSTGVERWHGYGPGRHGLCADRGTREGCAALPGEARDKGHEKLTAIIARRRSGPAGGSAGHTGRVGMGP